MNSNNIIKYSGNTKYFAALYKEKDKYFIIFALTNGINIIEKESYNNFSLFAISAKAEISFKENHNSNSIFHIIELNNIQEFNSIIKILECIL